MKLPLLLLRLYYVLVGRYFYARFGYSSIILNPLRVDGKKNIAIGDNVVINRLSWLYAKTHISSPVLEIGDGCRIGHFNHITCTNYVKIGKKVLTADKVFITDNIHDYHDISLAVMDQGIISKGETIIGDGTWIGENACVISAHVGRNCVIGANSVVTKDIPDYSIAIGAPATIIKQYDQISSSWKAYKETNGE